MPRLRVFHLIKSLGRGGAETLLSQGLRCADRDGYEFGYGYFLPFKNQLEAELRGQDADVVCFGGRSSAEVALRVPLVARHLRTWRADVVHCHLPVSGVCGRFAGKIAGVPVVYTEHNLQERYRPMTRALNVRTWRLQKRVIAVSAEVRGSAEKHAGTAVPIEVVNNGVSLGRFSSNAARRRLVRAEYGIAPSSYVVGTCAVFRDQKRLDLWLQVAEEVVANIPDTRFLLVGDGPLRAQVEAQIRARDLGGCVSLPGLQEDVRGYLDAMDVFFMSSDFEGLPVAMLEAMSMQKPIVATDAGGIPEVLTDESGGICVPRGDTAAMASALRLLGRARAHRDELGERGRARVSADFSMTSMQARLEELYREVVEGSR